jgi:hypothetical protein
MTTTEHLLLEMLKATTLALRVALGSIEAPYAQTAATIATEVVTDPNYRELTPAQRAAMADAGTAIQEMRIAAKWLKVK